MLRTPGKQRGVMYFAVFFLTMLAIVFGAFLGEKLPLFSDHPKAYMNYGEFYTTLALTLSILAALFILLHRNFRIPIAWGWIVLLLIMAVGNAVGTFMFGTHFEGTITYRGDQYDYDLTFVVAERVEWVICFCVACVYFYLFLVVFPKVFPQHRWLRFYYWLGVLTAIAALVYSLIAEFSLYQALFDPDAKVVGVWLKSFTNNENTFGFVLLLGTCCLCVLHNSNSRFFYWILMVLIAVFQVFVLSATSIVCTWLLLLIYSIYRYKRAVMHKPVRSTLLLLLLIAGGITILVFLFADPFGPTSFFGKLHAEISKYLDGSSTTFSTRVDTWNLILATLDNPLKWTFGIGDFQARIYLGALQVPTITERSAYPAHNTFLQPLIDGGLIRFAFFILVIGRVVYFAVKRANAHSKIVWPVLFGFIVMMINGAMESTYILSMDAKGFVLMLYFLLPLEAESFHATHPSLQKYLQDSKKDAKKVYYRYEYSPVRMAKIAFFFLTPVLVIGAGVGAVIFNMGYFGAPADWSFYLLFAFAFLFGPLAYFGFGFAEKKKAPVTWFTLLFIALLGAGIGLSWVNVLFPRIIAFALLFICLLPWIFHAKAAYFSFKTLLKEAYLPHLIIGGILTGLCLVALAIPATDYSTHIPVVMALAAFVACHVAMALPKKLKINYPFAEKWHHFDSYALGKSVIREEKLAKRQLLRYNPHYVPPAPKRIYIYRP